MDPPNDLGGDKGHVQDQYELGPRSFGQKLEEPEAVKIGFFQGTFSASKKPPIAKIRALLFHKLEKL